MKALLIAVLTFSAAMASSAFAAREINQPQRAPVRFALPPPGGTTPCRAPQIFTVEASP